MATPRVSDTPEVQRQYVTQLAISAALARTIQQMWAATSPLSSDRGMRAFRASVNALVTQFAQASRSTALDYYVNLRRAAEVPGTPTLRPVDLPPTSLVDAGIDWAMRDFLQKTEAQILAKVEAAMAKAVLDVGREQVVEAVEGDAQALGFRRVVRPGACYWCISLALRRSTRGGEGDQHIGVYKSRASAGQLPPNDKGEVNRYHDHCHCSVEPVFEIGDDAIPDWLHEMERLYGTSTADSKSGERLNDFRRALAAARNGETPTRPTGPSLAVVPAMDERLRLMSELLAGIAA